MRTLAAVLVALGVCACSNDPAPPSRCTSDAQCGSGAVCDTGTCKTASSRTVGEACTGDAACSVGSLCATNMPGGLCTYTCAGDTCPGGAVCTDLRAAGSGIICSPACSTTCRTGYVCCPGWSVTATTSAPGACVPAAGCPAQNRPASADLGKPCTATSCAAGEICGAGPEFPTGGACTSGCNPADQSTCPTGSSCVSTSTGSFCFAACSAPTDCTNLNAGLSCTGGLCRSATSSPACSLTGTAPIPDSSPTLAGPATQPACDPTAVTTPQPSVLQTIPGTSNVKVVGTEITVDVPPGTGSMSIYSQGASVPKTSVTLNGTVTIPNSVVPTLVKQPPTGAVIFDDIPAPPADASGLPIFYAGLSPFTGTMTVPNTSFLLEHTSLQGGLTPGTWKFTVNDFAQECGQVSNCTGGGTTDSYDVRVYLKPGIAPATGTVDFAFYFVGGPISFTAAPTNASFNRMLSSLAQMYASAGICIGKITLYDVQPWVKSAPEFSGNINADDDTPCGPLSRLFTLSQPGNQINIFLVNGFKNAAGSAINIVGVDGTIPGPSSIGGTVSSGAAANGSDLIDTTNCGSTFSPRLCGPDSVAYIVAHEAGHFMGLYHTTEQTGDFFDPISDTKTCACSACAPAGSARNACGAASSPTLMFNRYCVSTASSPQCGGGDDLMFWFLDVESRGTLTPQQGQVMRANPVVR
jgi:Cys-rich repeat protein